MEKRTEMEEFAKKWIYELKSDMIAVANAYQNKDRGWEKNVQFAIESRVWEERYRKVSQLCYEIGGETQAIFERFFPDELETYKSVI